MNALRTLGSLLFVFALGWSDAETLAAGATSSSGDQAGITVLARGPVHEAFAQPANPRPQPSAVIPKKPPAPIPEVPPDEQPRGKDVQWIPGYWDWDEEKNDFLWVSGTWRVPPPERKWVPGYWSQAADGWQWVAGFWAPAEQKQVQYLSAPPASAENESHPPAPLTGSAYVPGQWVFHNNHYVWRPGYWYDCQQGWVWIPGYYVWTPAGYVWVEGYWDFGPEDRGLLYAPVYFDQPLWTQSSWCYKPCYSVNVACLLDSLFFRPGCSRYCFGNYYSSVYRSRGYRPWCYHGPACFDPLFSYCCWINRANRFWERGLCDQFRARFLGTALCPAVTLREQTSLLRQAVLLKISNPQNLNVVSSLQSLRDRSLVTNVPPTQLEQQRTVLSHFQQVSLARSRAEMAGTRFTMAPSAPNGGAVVSSFRLPTHPGMSSPPGPVGTGTTSSAASMNRSPQPTPPAHAASAPASSPRSASSPSVQVPPRQPVSAAASPSPAPPQPRPILRALIQSIHPPVPVTPRPTPPTTTPQPGRPGK